MARETFDFLYVVLAHRSKSLKYDSGDDSERYQKMIAPIVAAAVTKKAIRTWYSVLESAST